jgi:hypothetical protein
MSLVKDSDWIRSKRDPEYDKLYGDRLWHWDMSDEYGWTEGNARWHRLNCSYWFGDWIEANGKENEQWKAYGARHRAIYLVREDLMAFIKLKWL